MNQPVAAAGSRPTLKVLVLTNYFPPEIGSGPHLPYELGETLVARGHRVTVVTGFPQYNMPEPPEAYRGKLLLREEMAGMTVHRIRASFYGKSILSRGLFHIVGPMTLALRAVLAERPDVVYSFSPPLPTGLLAEAVARRFGVPCLINVQDLFPQNAVDLGLLRNKPLIRVLEAMERRLYRGASLVTVMSDGNADYVKAKGVRPERVRTVYNWVDTDLIQVGNRQNGFREAHGIAASTFVVVFAGTMGWSQGLDVVVEAARLLADESDLLFLLVGGGRERQNLENKAESLTNVRFLPMQPRDVYPDVLAAADACLVTLHPDVATPAVPSKIATIMAAGRPILASLPPGDAPNFIQDAQSGLASSAGDPRALAEAVLRLKRDPGLARQMGDNGRRFAERCLSRSACIGAIEDLLLGLTGKGAFNASHPNSACKEVSASSEPVPAQVGPCEVRPAVQADLSSIARVHQAAFPGMLRSSLGATFLRSSYRELIRTEQGTLLVAEQDGCVVGFVAGVAEGVGRRPLAARVQLAVAAAWGLLKAPWLAWSLLSRLSNRFGRSSTLPSPGNSWWKLSPVAVLPERGGRGIGRKLVEKFVDQADLFGADGVFLEVARGNVPAIRLYQRLGFAAGESFHVPGHGEMIRYLLPHRAKIVGESADRPESAGN